ncbi:ATP-binding protein [Streptomyces glaucus]|uniref:ATP-binding protein n=1 Tax=Streptomyces glaucus TaxID=284029 RepID=UPI0031D33F37
MNQKTGEAAIPVLDFSVQLSATPRGARLARLLGAEQLRSWGLPLDPARQIIAELAVNAATHGRVPGRDFRLALHVVAGVLRIEVADTRGEELPRSQRPAPDAESGRGLLLVEALADRWGVTGDRFPRKTVWAELRLTPPEPGSPGSGAAGAFPEEREREKDPRRTPPLPPGTGPHSGG